MCWNEHVSLNTFLFSMFVLTMIKYNNEYTQYKIYDFSNNNVYFLFMSFIGIQLVEHHLWKNLDDEKLNSLITKIGITLIMLQPVFSILTIEDTNLRNKLLLSYGVPVGTYWLYKMNDQTIHTKIAKSGHLAWNWNMDSFGGLEAWIFAFYYLAFLYYPLYQTQNQALMIYSLILFGITYWGYLKDGSAGSLWCWSSNSIMIYYLINLLYFYPFIEHQQLC